MIGARRAQTALRRSVERMASSRLVFQAGGMQAASARCAAVQQRGLHSQAGSRWQQYTADVEESGDVAEVNAEFDQEQFDRDLAEGKYVFHEKLEREWTEGRPDPNALVEDGQFSEGARRTGVIGKKMGMVSLWDHWGKQYHCTVVWVNRVQVVSVNNTENRFGQIQLELGAGFRKPKNIKKPQLVHFKKAGVAPKQKLVSFPVSRDAVLPPGYELSARHFVPGQHVDVAGTTIGKGFQGVMKKWGFAGQPASHGASLSHRSIGSIGNNTSPGKVWKGKKMAGRMGGKRRTVQNVKVVKIDTKRNLLFLRGQIPGYAGNWVEVKDAIKKPFTADNPPPYPTYIPKEGDSQEQYLELPPPKDDPYFF